MDSLKSDLLRVLFAAKPGLSREFTLLFYIQGKNELADYFQEVRTPMAAMQSDPLPETVYVTVFMEGLRTGVSRTEVFQVHPSTYKKAVSIAQNAEHT